MNYSSSFTRVLVVSLFIHGVVITGWVLSVDGSDRLIANKIEIYLAVSSQNQSAMSEEILNFKGALVSIPKLLTVPKLEPKAIPVVSAKSKVEAESLADKPLGEPALMVEQKTKVEREAPSETNLDEIPDILLTQEQPTPDATEQIAQVKAVDAKDMIDQKEVDAIIEAENHYRTEVIRLIEGKKYYPKRLQKMRKEGDVLVTFTLHRNGSVVGIEVLNVKGSALFEKAALKAVRSAALFPSFPREIPRETWSFKVPLSYRLLRS
jgi:protein TonB